ncbi:MAG: Rab family GTPase [Candidatus Thorarchaeota archaeon]
MSSLDGACQKISSTFLKIALVGAGGVGKSAISARLSTGAFVESTMTIGLDVETWSFVDKDIGCEIKASLFDLGGQEHFRFFHEGFMTGANVVVIVFDVTRFKTFLDIDEWLPLIEQIPRDKWILVGNKMDEGIQVDEDEIKEKASKLGVPYILVSVKSGSSFDELVGLIKSKCTA